MSKKWQMPETDIGYGEHITLIADGSPGVVLSLGISENADNYMFFVALVDRTGHRYTANVARTEIEVYDNG